MDVQMFLITMWNPVGNTIGTTDTPSPSTEDPLPSMKPIPDLDSLFK